MIAGLMPGQTGINLANEIADAVLDAALPAIIAAYEKQKTAPAEPCTAHANGLPCARTDGPDHSRHIAADGRYWWEPEPCKHDDCTSLDCDPEPSVHCGATNDAGDECFLLEHPSRTDHAYPEH